MASSQPITIPNERFRADLTLLLVAVIWGSAFVAQRVAALNMNVYLFNGLRFLIGALVLTPFWLHRRKGYSRINLRLCLGICLAGLLLFAGTSFQQYGMRFTTAANAGFITGLYVVMIPIILALGLRQPPRSIIWIASILAVLGLFLLSTEGELKLARGDSLELAGALMWALHVILIGWLVRQMEVFPLAIMQYLVCGLLSLTVGLIDSGLSFSGLQAVWWTVLYTGVVSIGLGYTLQAVGQRVAPPADAAIILSCEAVFAALFGWLVIEERLTPIQLLGCGFMLIGMILAQIQPAKDYFINKLNQGEQSK